MMRLFGDAIWHGPNVRWRDLLVGAATLCLLASIILLAGARAAPSTAAAEATTSPPVLPGICSESDRFGLATTGGQVLKYDVERLHAGWYVNFTVLQDAPHPADMAFIQMIRLSDDDGDVTRACLDCPTWEQLLYAVHANPGAIWLIGNEPDSQTIQQDNVTPGRYAELYKVFYEWLNQQDPECLVGIGGVVQPTPIRLEYLEMILNAYAVQNPDEPFMPVDVWNVHNYVLRERRFGLPDSWGAGVPPGIPDDEGIIYDLDEHTMLDPCDPLEYPDDPHCADKIGWKRQLIELRQFMASNGYQDTPLIISEYGILMPAEYGYDWATVQAYMVTTFDWLRTPFEEPIGYPADENRLVQAWAWWPFDAKWTGHPPMELQAVLFDPESHAPTSLGTRFGQYTGTLTDPYPGTVDLRVMSVLDGKPVPEPGGTVVTVTAEIANRGADESGSFQVLFIIDGIEEPRIVAESLLPGQVTSLHISKHVQLGQTLQVSVTADPDNLVVECDPYNNQLTAELWVSDHAVFLPISSRVSDP